MCDRRKPAFNFALNAGRFALPVDGSCTTKERDMKRLIACVIGVALLAGSIGLTIANAQQVQAPAFIAGDRPSDRGASVGEVANGRMVKRRHLPQRQIYRSDRVHEWGGEQNGGRLANGSPSRRQR